MWWVIGKAGASSWSGVRVVQGPARGQSFGGTLPAGYQVIAGPFSSAAAARAAAPGSAPAGAGGGGTSQASGCGAKAIYTALTAAGFSTVQAVGAMANAIAESSLNPEASVIDSNGARSNGLWQFNEASYPNSGSLVTGNCAADITAQVGFLKSVVSGQALSGSTGAQVASNFAASFERCQGCQSGGAQNLKRAANAATVEGWIASGAWPAGGAGLSGGGTASASTAASVQGCLVSLNFVGCVLTRSEARGMIGGLLMAAGGLVMAAGLAVLVAGSLAGPAGKIAGQALSFTPVGKVAGVAGAAAVAPSPSPAPKVPPKPAPKTVQGTARPPARKPAGVSQGKPRTVVKGSVVREPKAIGAGK